MDQKRTPGPILCLCLLLIIGGGSALRLSYNAETFFIEPVRDIAALNLTYADNMVEHSTFSRSSGTPPAPDADLPPGYPAFLALNIKLAKALNVKAYDVILYSQAALGAGVILLCFLVATSMLPGYWPLLPAALVALSPHMISLGAYALPETLFSFSLIFFLYLLNRALNRNNLYLWLLSGIGFAITCVVNPVSAILLPAILLILWAYRHQLNTSTDRERQLKAACLLLLPLFVAASLWSLRTTLSVPPDKAASSHRLLTGLATGLYPDYYEKWRDSTLTPEENIELPGQGVDASYKTFLDELHSRVTEDPFGVLVWYTIEKPIQLWKWNTLMGQGEIYIYDVLYSLYHTSRFAMVSYSIMQSLHLWLIGSCALGAIYLVTGDRKQTTAMTLITYAAIFSFSMVYVIAEALPRYSIPLRPELYLGATFFLWRTTLWLKRLRQQQIKTDDPLPE